DQVAQLDEEHVVRVDPEHVAELSDGAGLEGGGGETGAVGVEEEGLLDAAVARLRPDDEERRAGAVLPAQHGVGVERLEGEVAAAGVGIEVAEVVGAGEELEAVVVPARGGELAVELEREVRPGQHARARGDAGLADVPPPEDGDEEARRAGDRERALPGEDAVEEGGGAGGVEVEGVEAVGGEAAGLAGLGPDEEAVGGADEPLVGRPRPPVVVGADVDAEREPEPVARRPVHLGRHAERAAAVLAGPHEDAGVEHEVPPLIRVEVDVYAELGDVADGPEPARLAHVVAADAVEVAGELEELEPPELAAGAE